MNRMRRMLATLVTALLVAGAFALPVFAQTVLEEEGLYDEVEVLPDDEEAVIDDVDERDEPVEEEVVPEEEPEPEVAVTVLQRTGANALLLSVVGLLVLGLGGFLVMRTRRGTTEA